MALQTFKITRDSVQIEAAIFKKPIQPLSSFIQKAFTTTKKVSEKLSRVFLIFLFVFLANFKGTENRFFAYQKIHFCARNFFFFFFFKHKNLWRNRLMFFFFKHEIYHSILINCQLSFHDFCIVFLIQVCWLLPKRWWFLSTKNKLRRKNFLELIKTTTRKRKRDSIITAKET